MARCPSPQEILTAAILRQKWIDEVTAKLQDTHENLSECKTSSKGKAKNATTSASEVRTLTSFVAEMISPETQKRFHFKGRASLLRALEEAIDKAHSLVDEKESFEKLTEQLREVLRTSSSVRPTDD